MATLHLLQEPEQTATGLRAQLSCGFTLLIDRLETDLLRIAVVPDGGLEVDRTWMIAPGATANNDGPVRGRDRLSTDGFSQPDASDLRWTVGEAGAPLQLHVEQRVGNNWQTLFCDRADSAWQWFERGHRLKHFQAMRTGVAHYGLGDKTGPLDRTGRRLRCLQTDSLGYDAERSDPLYKHAPWLIVQGADGACGGLLYDTMAETVFDLGAEHSNYFEPFRHVEMHERGCVLYALAGPQMRDLVPALHRLTGMPAMPSRAALGLGFTSMHHADHRDAQDVILDFAHEARRRELAISAIHLGSGYTAGADGLRYVFNWNEQRFPDRAGFFATLADMGYRTVANVKPVLLTGHERFETASAAGWFVRGGDGGPAVEKFWGGHGAQLDFTNRAAFDFWRERIRAQVLQPGFDGVWNDNNEAELWDEAATIDGCGKPLPGMDARPVHALLMCRASRDAMREHAPQKRPWGISRAGPIGIARYGETWTGDNRTSAHTLKWNLPQGLSMAISGFPFVGHDIGGFDGPPPGPELLVRWFQMMALHPRCVMNSWKPDHGNIPNLPWMHEDVFPLVKAAMDLRARFMPVLYSLAHRCHTTGHPPIAPLGYFDGRRLNDAGAFHLGPDVIVVPTTSLEGEALSMKLPKRAGGWFEFGSGHHHVGGSSAGLNNALDHLPIFIGAGAMLPLADGWTNDAPHDATSITFHCYPGGATGQAEDTFYTDHGDGFAHLDGTGCQLRHCLVWRDGAAEIIRMPLSSGASPVPLRYACANLSFTLKAPAP